MTILPKFITKKIQEKFEITPKFSDMEEMIKERGLLVHSWGRINIESSNNKELYRFNDDDEASEILINIIKEKYLKGRVEIFWSNAETCPIECGIDFLEKFAKEIIYEDWDLWIFCKKDWIIEKYHEGEMIFYKI